MFIFSEKFDTEIETNIWFDPTRSSYLFCSNDRKKSGNNFTAVINNLF